MHKDYCDNNEKIFPWTVLQMLHVSPTKFIVRRTVQDQFGNPVFLFFTATFYFCKLSTISNFVPVDEKSDFKVERSPILSKLLITNDSRIPRLPLFLIHSQ